MITRLLPAAVALLFAGAALNAQNQPVYWSTIQPNCGSFASRQLSNGGYVCEHYGLLPWYSAGAGWRSAIRTQAPSLGAVAIYYFFYDNNNNDSAPDSYYYNGSSFLNQHAVSFALFANEPAEVDVLGLPTEAPSYSRTTATGHVLVNVQCPDATTCSQASAQLMYSALPSQPWSLSVPIVWFNQETNAYSAVGIDDGLSQKVAIVIYNDSTLQETFQLRVYNSIGNEISGSPASITLASGNTTGRLLRDLFPGLPTGIFKIKLTGSFYSSFVALQFNGPSATSLIVTPEGTLAPDTVGNSYSPHKSPIRALSTAQLGSVQRHAE